MTSNVRPIAAALLLALPATVASAHPQHDSSVARPYRIAQATKPPAETFPVTLEQALYLIRSTLLTLNDANRSGNYTVLRDLASPGFQAANTAADLAQHFADLRKRNFDLHAVAISAPQLTAPPHIEQNNMLRLTGYFPTQPLRINFDMLFQNVGGQWRLFGLSVATPQAPAQQPAAQPPSPPPDSKTAKPPRR